MDCLNVFPIPYGNLDGLGKSFKDHIWLIVYSVKARSSPNLGNIPASLLIRIPSAAAAGKAILRANKRTGDVWCGMHNATDVAAAAPVRILEMSTAA